MYIYDFQMFKRVSMSCLTNANQCGFVLRYDPSGSRGRCYFRGFAGKNALLYEKRLNCRCLRTTYPRQPALMTRAPELVSRTLGSFTATPAIPCVWEDFCYSIVLQFVLFCILQYYVALNRARLVFK